MKPRLLLSSTTRGASVRYLPVFLSAEEQTNFYEGFSNEILWPLFHDLQSRCNFAPRYWEFYLRVNQRFAVASLHPRFIGLIEWKMENSRALKFTRLSHLCDLLEKFLWRAVIE